MNQDELGNLKERYKLLDVLGSGGMGTVYKAYDEVLQRYLAIKFISNNDYGVGNSNSKQSTQRFQREAKALSLLNHSNLVKIYDFGVTDDNKPFMTMEYLEGETLKSVAARTLDYEFAKLFEIIEQICKGLDHVHERGIVHRDLKSTNIIVNGLETGSAEVKLIDFGISTVIERSADKTLTPVGQLIGSPLYMSPEQARGQTCEHTADLYSLGCVIYELLTGKTPFSGDSAMETVQQHLNDPVPTLADAQPDREFPQELEDIIQILLAKDAADRKITLAELKEKLDVMVEEELEVEVEEAEQSIPEILVSNIDEDKNSFSWYIVIVGLLLIAMAVFAFGIVGDDSEVEVKNSKNGKAKSEESAPLNYDNFSNKYHQREVMKGLGKDSFVISGNPAVMDNDIRFLKEKDLTRIEISDTGLGDETFSYIAHMPLRFLDASKSKVSNKGLSYIRDMTSLQNLNLSKCDTINGAGLIYLRNLTNLEELNLRGCMLFSATSEGKTTEIYKNLSALTNLIKLKLGDTGFTEKEFVIFKDMKKLEKLDLSDNLIDDKSLKTLYLPVSLKFLDLASNRGVTDRTISLLVDSKIEKLEIGKTNITDRGVQDLAKMKSLVELDVRSCKQISSDAVSGLKQKRPNLTISSDTI